MSTVSNASTAKFVGESSLGMAERIISDMKTAKERYETDLIERRIIAPAPADSPDIVRYYRTELGNKAHFGPRLYRHLPPTVIAQRVCMHWFCQHSCQSLDTNIPFHKRPVCNLVHPAIIDYELVSRLGLEFAEDTTRTQGCIQLAPNTNRCHFFAYNGWCGHRERHYARENSLFLDATESEGRFMNFSAI